MKWGWLYLVWADNTPISVNTKPSKTLPNLGKTSLQIWSQNTHCIGEKSKRVPVGSVIHPLVSIQIHRKLYPIPNERLWNLVSRHRVEKSRRVWALIHPLVSIQTHRKLFTSVSKIRPNSTTKGFKERANLIIKENIFVSWILLMILFLTFQNWRNSFKSFLSQDSFVHEISWIECTAS